MPMLDLGDVRLNYRDEGDPAGAAIVLAHALGADLQIWDGIVPLLPPGLRILRFDMRGHGQSSVPPGPYGMGTLVRDAERFMDSLGVRDAVFVGLSIGGMIAQGLAVKRLDLIRGLVLSNTAAKIATPEIWQARIDAVQKDGLGTLADATMERWFTRPFRQAGGHLPSRARMVATPVEGYIGCAGAIAGTDFYSTTATLTLPTLVIAAAEDSSTPPDLVRETAELIRGADFRLMRKAGHLPCVEKPEEYAGLLTEFLDRIAHAGAACGCGAPHHHHHH